MARWLRHLPTATFLHQMGVASIIAGVILLALSWARKAL